jgi:serine/threonine-protein kinase
VGVAAAFLLMIAVAGALLVQQRNRALRNAERARENARRAQREAETAEQVSDFLVNLMQRSNPYGPSRSGDSTLTVREALERGADRIDEFDGQPAVQAELRTVIGTSFERLGRLDKAGSMLKAAVAQRRRIQAPDTTIAQSLHRLADYHEEVGNYEAADSLYLEALSIRRSVLGPNHRDVATTLSKLGSIRWYNMGDFAAADSFLHEALRIRKTVFDTAHVELATIYNNLASLYHRQADYDQAETYYRNAIDMYRRLHGQHPDLGIVQGNFAVLLRSRGKYDEAETAMRAAIATQREMVGENSIDVALRTASLGRILLEQGRLAAADSVYDVARSKLRALYDPPHPYLVKVTWGEGEIRRRRGKLDAAERLFRDAQSALKEVYPPDHQNHAKPLVGLGQIRMEQGRLAAADSLFSEALALRTDAFGANNWLVAVTQGELGRCRTLQGRYREADSLLTTAYDVLRNKRPEGERYRTRVRHALVQLYERWGRPEAAEKYRQGAKAQAGTD